MSMKFKLRHMNPLLSSTLGAVVLLVSCIGTSFCGALPPCSTKYAAELEKKHELLSEIKEDTYVLEIGVQKDLDRQEKDVKIKEYNLKKVEIMGKPLSANIVQSSIDLTGMSSMSSAVTPEKNPEFVKTQEKY